MQKRCYESGSCVQKNCATLRGHPKTWVRLGPLSAEHRVKPSNLFECFLFQGEKTRKTRNCWTATLRYHELQARFVSPERSRGARFVRPVRGTLPASASRARLRLRRLPLARSNSAPVS